MSRKNPEIDFAIAMIAMPFRLIGWILNAIDKAEEDESRRKRREVLNQGTQSMIERRELMNEKSLHDIELAKLRQENETLKAKKLVADTNLALARAAAIENQNAKFQKPGMELPSGNVTYNECPNCGDNQSQALGNTCQNCGGTMQATRSYVN